MTTVLTIARTEARRIFVSPLAWAVLFVLQLILGFIFANMLFSYAQNAGQMTDQFVGVADYIGGGLFGFATVLLLLVMPLMTMRLFAEERKNGSITLLFSAPASLIEIVLGKFLGLVSFMLAVIVLLALMPLTLRSGTHLDLGFIAAGLLGLFLMMLAFGAAGIAMGTRFLMTAESPVPRETLQRYLDVNDPAKIRASTAVDGMPQRMIDNPYLLIFSL